MVDTFATVKPSALLAFFSMAAVAAGQVVVPAREAAGAASYWPGAAQASSNTLRGKLIKLRFVCRSSVTEKTADGGVTGEVIDSPTTRLKMDVKVPKNAVAWFMNVPTTFGSGPPFTVYARLSTDKFGVPVAELLGRKLRSGPGSSSIEW
jgi:hypothetical protein